MTCVDGKVTHLNLTGNGLHGTIPEAMGNLTSLTSLDLKMNTLGGTIPASFQRLNALNRVDVSQNLLSGDVPPGMEELGLVYLDLRMNQLTGFPGDWSQRCPWDELAFCDFSANNLSWPIPEWAAWRCDAGVTNEQQLISLYLNSFLSFTTLLVALAAFVLLKKRRSPQQLKSDNSFSLLEVGVNDEQDELQASEMKKAISQLRVPGIVLLSLNTLSFDVMIWTWASFPIFLPMIIFSVHMIRMSSKNVSSLTFEDVKIFKQFSEIVIAFESVAIISVISLFAMKLQWPSIGGYGLITANYGTISFTAGGLICFLALVFVHAKHILFIFYLRQSMANDLHESDPSSQAPGTDKIQTTYMERFHLNSFHSLCLFLRLLVVFLIVPWSLNFVGKTKAVFVILFPIFLDGIAIIGMHVKVMSQSNAGWREDDSLVSRLAIYFQQFPKWLWTYTFWGFICVTSASVFFSLVIKGCDGCLFFSLIFTLPYLLSSCNTYYRIISLVQKIDGIKENEEEPKDGESSSLFKDEFRVSATTLDVEKFDRVCSELVSNLGVTKIVFDQVRFAPGDVDKLVGLVLPRVLEDNSQIESLVLTHSLEGISLKAFELFSRQLAKTSSLVSLNMRGNPGVFEVGVLECILRGMKSNRSLVSVDMSEHMRFVFEGRQRSVVDEIFQITERNKELSEYVVSIKRVDLSYCWPGQDVPDWLYTLSWCLTELDLSGNEIDVLSDAMSTFEELRVLKLDNCPNLKSIQGIVDLEHLEEVSLENCPKLQIPPEIYSRGVDVHEKTKSILSFLRGNDKAATTPQIHQTV